MSYELYTLSTLSLAIMPIAETKRKPYIRSKSLTMEVKALFEKAIADSKALPEKPSNETLLNLYSLYKQSTEGDVKGEAPAMFDFVAKAKYESWSSLKGKTQEAAMQEYINLVEKLKA